MRMTFIEKMRLKSPLKSPLVRGLTCFDPKLILYKATLGVARMKTVLEIIFNSKRISENLAENARKEYLLLTKEVQTNRELNIAIISFLNDTSDKVGLDEFYESLIGHSVDYKALYEVIKICLIFSHGNASVEGGFSVNKNLLVENLQEESLISQRIIRDEIKQVGGIHAIKITPKMIIHVKNSRKRYYDLLEKKKKEYGSDDRKIDKRKIEKQLKELDEKKKKLTLKEKKKTSSCGPRKSFWKNKELICNLLKQ